MCGYKIKFPLLPQHVEFTNDAIQQLMDTHSGVAAKVRNIETGSDYMAVEFIESFNPNNSQKTAIKNAVAALLTGVIEVPTSKQQREQDIQKHQMELRAVKAERKEEKEKQQQQQQQPKKKASKR